jgi:hypothetical protein
MSAPTSTTILDWLGMLGMPEYAELFAENKINISALRYLTDQDLKDIGIPLGHRRIMQAAISELARAAGPLVLTLGNPKIDEARQKAVAETVDRANQRAANVIPIIRQIQWSGATSLRQIAETLNARDQCPARRAVAHDLGLQHADALLA